MNSKTWVVTLTLVVPDAVGQTDIVDALSDLFDPDDWSVARTPITDRFTIVGYRDEQDAVAAIGAVVQIVNARLALAGLQRRPLFVTLSAELEEERQLRAEENRKFLTHLVRANRQRTEPDEDGPVGPTVADPITGEVSEFDAFDVERS